ncbi:uncharacterized protein LOC121390272 [Gigantopelta aegis]|uniref:uncharacterized protein LOC121390272 n=1 Tax=Gigantopelta aegis TaxID=1735272 RepID=UPI001B88CE65|nr:uncharacterized protein LOC121390272 [Gigantopelta aegis]
MEKQGRSFDAEFQSLVLSLHRLVKIMNYLTSFSETDLHHATRQKMDAEAMLQYITYDIRQLKATLSQYQQELCVPCLNTKQNKMEEFIASFETPKVTETDSKGTTTKKKPKQTTTTPPLTSGMKIRLRTLTEMAKDIGRQEEESSHIRDLVSMVELLEDLTHSVALELAIDRGVDRQNPSAHQCELDSHRNTKQGASNAYGCTII